MIESDLVEQIAGGAHGRFKDDAWEINVYAGGQVSHHERQHRILNDITTYGAMLDAIARLARGKENDHKFSLLLRRLVGRARTTHEVCASYFGGCDETLETDEVPRSLWGNIEYQSFYKLGEELVKRGTTYSLGNGILWAVVRIAMNGPLPAHVLAGNFEALELTDFRAIDAPDSRLPLLMRIFTTEFCQDVCARAKARFGGHPDWVLFIERPKGLIKPEHLMKFRAAADGTHFIEPNAITPTYATDVSNFIVDQFYLELPKHNLKAYLLSERREIEQTIREAVIDKSDRFYDDPEQFEDFNRRRDFGREVINLRPAPLQTSIMPPLKVSDEDWSLFRRIFREEGNTPLYIRTTADFLANHDVVAKDESVMLPTDGIVCFTRKKRQISNDEIGLDVVMMADPIDIMTVATHVGAFRVCVSGKLLTEAWRPELSQWMRYVEGQVSILIDDHPQRIVEGLTRNWEALTFVSLPIEGIDGVRLLVIYPVGEHEDPPFAMFRPASTVATDATLKLLHPSPVDQTVRRLGGRIVGLSQGALRGDWAVPEHALWTMRRYWAEEMKFRPTTPEEFRDGRS